MVTTDAETAPVFFRDDDDDEPEEAFDADDDDAHTRRLLELFFLPPPPPPWEITRDTAKEEQEPLETSRDIILTQPKTKTKTKTMNHEDYRTTTDAYH